MQYRAKRVLVTGAGGFIGSHPCEALLGPGAEVTAMIHCSSRSDWGNLEFLPPDLRAQLKVVAGNIEDSHFVERQVSREDVVFHLAALITVPFSYIAPLSYVRTNVEGTLNPLEAARHAGVGRVVHTSTSETTARRSMFRLTKSIRCRGRRPIQRPRSAPTRSPRVITVPLTCRSLRSGRSTRTDHGSWRAR